MTENVLSFRGSNIGIPNTNINVPSTEDSATSFRFGKVKVNNNDDEIEFLGSNHLINDTNGSNNKAQNRHGDDNDVVFVAETVPTDFMANVRSEVGPTTEPVPSFFKRSLEIAPTTSTVKLATESDEMAINNILEKVIDAVILPWPYQTTSDESGSSTAAFNANEANVTCSILCEQNSASENERSIRTVEEELTSAKAACVSMDVDDDNDVLIVDESKNENIGVDEEVLKKAKRISDKSGDPDLEVIGNSERFLFFL
ncbi:unnamed protein product [Onchocerca flexuosa]|uniref:Zinc finger protein n=1 Tax=Onchocerca flexuosa TaxID=387005 RepID=A0A183HIK5_9BILA|nr:unnamed protein product [Onchocerca flexuosa]